MEIAISQSYSAVSPRVLVVDNDQSARETLQELILFWGYIPIAAHGVGKSLIEDAKKKAREYRCQLAIVDMRLIDNFDRDDKSGLDLIEAIKPTKSIMISAYEDVAIANESRERGAVYFMTKRQDVSEKKEKLQSISKKICAHDRKLILKPSNIVPAIAKNFFDSSIDVGFYDQIADILARLFPDAAQLHLERLGSSSFSSEISTVPRPHSFVLKVIEDDLQPVIVKFARPKKVEKEVDRYKKHIDGRLKGLFYPDLRGHEILWDLGAMKFRYVGNIDQTFAVFYQNETLERISNCLTSFFSDTWSPHYNSSREVGHASLFSSYCQVWGSEWYDRASNSRIPQLFSNDTEGAKAWSLILEHNNPIDWLRMIMKNEGGSMDPSVVDNLRIAVTHGDLHADNLLVDESLHGWVIDFERTGDGHVLQDFIELEFDILNRLNQAKGDLKTYYHLCLALTGSHLLTQTLINFPTLLDPDTQKLLRTIMVIRNLAVQRTGITDARQYLMGLFFNAVFRATIAKGDQDVQKDLHTWLLASILCHRLKHWDDQSPFDEWQTSL